MTFKTYDINIDLVNESSTTSTIHFSTNDRNAAKLLLTITNKGAELDLSQAKSVRISFKKPDGTRVFQNDCLPINVLKGKYQIVLNTQTLAVEGYVYAQVHIEEEDKTIDTQKFFFVVNESLASDEAVESTNEFGVMQKFIEAGEKFKDFEDEDFDALIASKETAEQAKLAAEQNANQIEILSEKTFYTRKSKPTVSAVFIDDDGKQEVWTRLKPIFEFYGVPLTLAIIDSWIDKPDCLSLEQILHLQNVLGWEMGSHTINHVHLAEVAAANYPEAKKEIFESKSNLSKKGLNIESIIYPFGDDSEAVHDLSRNAYYNSGVDTQEGVNTIPIETYRLKRIAMGSYFATPSTEYPITTTFNDYYKPRIDEAITKNGLIIFKLHCASVEHTEEQQTYIRQTIEYLQSKGVPIVNLRDALKVFRNSLEYGTNNAGNDFTVIGPTGKLDSSGLVVNLGGNIKDVNAPLDTVACPIRKETIQFVSYNDRVGWPENKSGVVKTSHYPDATYVYRMYYPVGSNKFYKQNWDNTNKVWSAFELVSGVEVVKKTANNAVTSTHTITDPALESGKITYVPINTAGATGFPKDQAGLLIADRTNPSNGYQYERYLQYQSNRQYLRNTTSAGDFKGWEELARKDDNYTKTCTFGAVAAQSHLDFDTGLTGTIGEFVLLSPTNGKMLDGVNFTGYINDQSKIIVRAINYTAAEKTVANKDFRITVIKAF
ncbi:BppU family phage baseplate upper protein [Bacillus cereus]|uniref:BppU family phage baseplate upper protein n=1 Tax=Bacillus cereus TaxID=1396 RepID=UPI0014820863|nr:BppU family phage baseplate upper protein [Bacillus cereus]